MRIDTYNQVASIYKLNQPRKATAAYGANAYSKDEVSISQAGKDFQIARQAVANAKDVREDKVEALKRQIENGTYNVKPEDFAAKLLEKYNALGAY